MQDRATVQQTQKRPVKRALSVCVTGPRPGARCSPLVQFTVPSPSRVGSGRGLPPATPLPPLEMLQPSLLSWVSIFIFRDKLCPGINYV